MTDKDKPNNLKRFTPLPDDYVHFGKKGEVTMPLDISDFTIEPIQVPVGICVLDHFAMSFIQRGDTVEDAFRNAALAMEERKKYI